MDLLRNLGILAALTFAVAACGGDDGGDDATIDSDSDTETVETDTEA